MFYKVMKNGRVIDVLDQIIFLKYQKKHNIMVICPESEAEAILSSDRNSIWGLPYLNPIPVNGYDMVEIQEIDQYEYNQLRILNLKTPEEIIDAYTLSLINGGVL